MRELTARQRQLLEFIEDYIGTYGFPPSIREMADQMGIRSTNGVNDHLKALQKKGYISRHEGLKSRAISLLKPSEPASSGHDQPPAVEVPILGRVAAGVPVLSEENFEGTLPLGSDLLPASGRVFALRVHGESMIGKGILDGDTVVVHSRRTPHPGDMVVAMIDEEVTVKTFRRTKNTVRLEPANPDFEPIVIRRSDFTPAAILGVVTGVFRRIH